MSGNVPLTHGVGVAAGVRAGLGVARGVPAGEAAGVAAGVLAGVAAGVACGVVAGEVAGVRGAAAGVAARVGVGVAALPPRQAAAVTNAKVRRTIAITIVRCIDLFILAAPSYSAAPTHANAFTSGRFWKHGQLTMLHLLRTPVAGLVWQREVPVDCGRVGAGGGQRSLYRRNGEGDGSNAVAKTIGWSRAGLVRCRCVSVERRNSDVDLGKSRPDAGDDAGSNFSANCCVDGDTWADRSQATGSYGAGGER